ncbi:N-acetylneuraminate 9-O-acetyltransferase-like [Panonychus citri]|uniref:N-acetylneuraminate 9-O-acetyltransferase-like n=1 Tax=Panonychus citri TaxID=50023 RepID=UPI00230730F6|nr:N-acetylneuraminate 9-O-acetyltransferase-like [Panonychus citri]XP_053207164.1 N-acetylneuraminate 9-O-acetyltransferase-like [Panonychus citri]
MRLLNHHTSRHQTQTQTQNHNCHQEDHNNHLDPSSNHQKHQHFREPITIGMNEDSGRNSSDYIVHHFNSQNAKKIATILVISLILYHSVLHIGYGINSCKWLLSDGRLQGYREWQPYGCMLHTYSKMDSRVCLRYIAYWGGQNYIVFIGDSRIRQLYYAFINLINPNLDTPIVDSPVHHDMKVEEKDLHLKVEFLWRPVINESMFTSYQNWLNSDISTRPEVVVTGSGTWTIKSSNASLKALENYKTNLTRLLPYMDRMGCELFWVLQDPVNPEKLDPSRSMISNEQIDLYNKAAINVLKYTTSPKVHIWSSARLVSQGYSDDQKDGLHMGQTALNYAVQILLNMYCNDQMNHNDGTCCSDPESITNIQILTFSFILVCSILAVTSVVHRFLTSHSRRRWQPLIDQEEIELMDKGHENNGNGNSLPPVASSSSSTPPKIHSSSNRLKEMEKSYHELLTSLAKFGILMAFFFLCDRTNFFMKENKYYTHTSFFLPVAYVFALGLFFTEESRYTYVLHRDQTDEWKGYMQLIVLIYHMTGASQILSIYFLIRSMVAAYLFLSGYGHFTYFWHTGDFSFQRVWKVLFRLNILVVFLCLMMSRPYQFYYFVPLITFWFIIIYATMSSFPQVTSSSAEVNPIHHLYLILKFVALLIVISVLYMSEVFFEKIFLTRPWKALFVTTDDSIKEWEFRWKLDRYAVPAGMLFGYFYYLLKHFHILDDKNHGNLFSRGISLIVTASSLLGIIGYASFAFLCHNKEECNVIHAYISFIPVVSYISLRNISGLLRSRYSIFFAWFGRISLELFICQYHIWLAADTHGVLVLIPSFPVLNVIVTSFIYVCISHEINLLTRTLVKYAISPDWRYMTMNLLIFLLILIPLGIRDGMF